MLVRAADDINQLSVAGQIQVQLVEPLRNVVYADWQSVSISGPFAITIDELPSNNGITSVSGAAAGNFQYWRFVGSSTTNDVVQALPDTVIQPQNISRLTVHFKTISGGTVSIASTDYLNLVVWTKLP